jgi:hypothetical protein
MISVICKPADKINRLVARWNSGCNIDRLRDYFLFCGAISGALKEKANGITITVGFLVLLPYLEARPRSNPLSHQ